MRWRWYDVAPAVMYVMDSDCRDHQCVDCADAIAGAAGAVRQRLSANHARARVQTPGGRRRVARMVLGVVSRDGMGGF